MTKDKLISAVEQHIASTREALQLLWDSINKGQRKQLFKQPEIKELLDRYGVEVEE